MEAFVQKRRYRGPVQGVVLDWAGTAVDYGSLGPVAVFVEVFKKHGVEVSVAEARAFMGMAKKDHIRGMLAVPAIAGRWRRAHGEAPDEEAVARLYADTEPMMVAAVARHAAPIPGLRQAVAAFRQRGVKVGASTGYTAPIMAVLAEAAAENGYAPDASVCSSDAPNGRPYPWMCYLNAIRLGVYPMAAMVKVGDTVADIHEGLNAGMWTIGVTQTGNELGLSEAEVAALTAEDLLGRLAHIEERLIEAGAHYVAAGIWSCPAIIDDIGRRLKNGETPLPEGK
jgi:phosphonoacetaldehyde hydrolase